MPRVSLRTLFVTVVVLITAFQLSVVTLAALPPNKYSDAVSPHVGYLTPFFTQNWRLFAPSPIAEDRTVLFQGSYLKADGSPAQTAWVDWTEVELDLVHHRVVGGRAGYITNKLFSPLDLRFRSLTDAERAVAEGGSAAGPSSWAMLSSGMVAADKRPNTVAFFLRYERATVRLATDVLLARWPNRRFTAVRYAVRSQGVVPYAARSGSAAERKASRPAVSERRSGWRVPTPGSAKERRAIASFDRRHR